MDDIDSFFNFSKEFKRVPISGGYVNGRVLPSTDDKQTVKREVQGTEYVKEYQEAEAEQLQKVLPLRTYGPTFKPPEGSGSDDK